MTYNPNHLANANAQAAASMRSAGIGSVGGKPITSSAQKIQDMFKESRERRRDKAKSSGLGAPTTAKVEPEEDDRNLDQKIYDFFVGAGADMEPKEEEPMYMMDFYGGPMFAVPEPAPVERQVLSSPFDAYNVDTYNFGGYYDTRDTSPSIGSTVDPDMQDPRRGLMAAPTMSQPSTPEELTDVPRALAMSAAVPTKTYTIKSGDTLSEIARDNNTTVKALMSLNTQIEKADEIDAGAKIEIPVTPTGFEGMGPDPSTGKPVQGLMSPATPEPVDAIKASKEEVKEIQKLLGVTADGVIGPNTMRAMASFQYRAGLPVSGKIDTATMEALKNPDSVDPRNVKARMDVLNNAGDAPDMTKIKEWAKETIADPLKAAAFVATVEAETGERDLVETGYNKERAIEVFVDRNALPDGTLGPKMTARKAAIEALPSDYSADDIFDIVYGNRLGNDQPTDGSKYKGRGLIMITGKSNYKKVGDIIGVDLVTNPELVNDPQYAAAAAMAYLSLPGKNFFAKDITQTSLADTVGHSDDRNNTEAKARFDRAKELKEEMYP